MNINITLENITQKEFILPYSYEEYIQAFLYRLSEQQFGNFLHDVGYSYKGRRFRLFSFSRILEAPLKIIHEKHVFIFPNRITFVVSTIENRMVEALVQSISQFDKKFQIGKYEVVITSIEMIPIKASSDVVVKTLSPVCIYSTALLLDGRKRTIYYSPEEKEFSELVRKNAIKKYCAYYQEEPEDDSLEVIPLGRMKEVKSSYKGFVIKGYNGKFRLKGSEKLIKIMLEAGMGGKNAEGKGMIVIE